MRKKFSCLITRIFSSTIRAPIHEPNAPIPFADSLKNSAGFANNVSTITSFLYS